MEVDRIAEPRIAEPWGSRAPYDRDSTLLTLTQEGHPDTLRHPRLANAILKLRAGQALAGR